MKNSQMAFVEEKEIDFIKSSLSYRSHSVLSIPVKNAPIMMQYMFTSRSRVPLHSRERENREIVHVQNIYERVVIKLR